MNLSEPLAPSYNPWLCAKCGVPITSTWLGVIETIDARMGYVYHFCSKLCLRRWCDD